MNHSVMPSQVIFNPVLSRVLNMKFVGIAERIAVPLIFTSTPRNKISIVAKSCNTVAFI